MELSTDQSDAFRRAVESAAGREEVGRAVRNVYLAVQDAIDLRQPLCQASGRCCRFEQFGHRLFLTTLEMAAFIAELRQLPNISPTHNPGGCVFQQERLCGVHTIRPFGCRIFYCDPSATEWQQEQYARFHAELKRLHERLGVSYFYVEWREALRCMGLEPAPESQTHVNSKPLL